MHWNRPRRIQWTFLASVPRLKQRNLTSTVYCQVVDRYVEPNLTDTLIDHQREQRESMASPPNTPMSPPTPSKEMTQTYSEIDGGLETESPCHDTWLGLQIVSRPIRDAEDDTAEGDCHAFLEKKPLVESNEPVAPYPHPHRCEDEPP